MNTYMKLVINKAQCKLCNDILVSRTIHDNQVCSCGNLFIDGGLEYANRSVREKDAYIELSEWEDDVERSQKIEAARQMKGKHYQCKSCMDVVVADQEKKFGSVSCSCGQLTLSWRPARFGVFGKHQIIELKTFMNQISK